MTHLHLTNYHQGIPPSTTHRGCTVCDVTMTGQIPEGFIFLTPFVE
jgi:hypothetical protein